MPGHICLDVPACQVFFSYLFVSSKYCSSTFSPTIFLVAASIALQIFCARRQWNLHTKLSSSTLISSVLTYSRHCSRQNQSLMTECAVRKYACSNVRGDSHAFGIHPTSSLPKHQRLAHLIVHMQHYGLFMQDQALNLLRTVRDITASCLACVSFSMTFCQILLDHYKGQLAL